MDRIDEPSNTFYLDGCILYYILSVIFTQAFSSCNMSSWIMFEPKATEETAEWSTAKSINHMVSETS